MERSDQRVLQVRDMCVDFSTPAGVVHAVSNVSFDLGRGEILGIVGESGSGKSTTAKALMRLLPKTAKVGGDILLLGHDIQSVGKKQFNKVRGKDVTMIFQDPMTSLNPVYTVGNQLTETLKLHMGMSGARARARVVELLELVSIPQPELRLKQYPHEFSGGMRQRVMIAMALACDPAVLLADEPTTALDVTIQAQILELMRGLKGRLSTSIIMITHDLGIVSDLCDRVLVMYGGELMETGTIDDLFYRTAHPYTKGLLNCLPQTAATKGMKRLEPIGGTPLDLMMLPQGCVFASRCARCMKLCLKRKAGLYSAGEGHMSRCWLTALEGGAA